jgi:hypothetical protein
MKLSKKEQKKTRKKKEKGCWTEGTGRSGAPHQTVRCALDSSVHGPANCLLSGILACVDYNSLDRPRGASNSPVCQSPTASCHVSRGPMVKWSTRQSGAPRTRNQPITRFCAHTLFTVRCASYCPVHSRTEGNQCLPNGAPTTPRSFGAIKGTPRHMEFYTMHPLNIIQH